MLLGRQLREWSELVSGHTFSRTHLIRTSFSSIRTSFVAGHNIIFRTILNEIIVLEVLLVQY